MARPRTISDEAIDRTAREVFVAHGASAPVALIAKRLGVTHAALLQRAGSKEALLLRALLPGSPKELLALLDAPPPPERARAALVRLLDQLAQFLSQALPGLLVLSAAGVQLERALGREVPPPVAFRRGLSRWLRRTRRLPAAKSSALAEALLSSLEAACFHHHIGGPSFVDTSHRRALTHLIDALAPELRVARSPCPTAARPHARAPSLTPRRSP